MLAVNLIFASLGNIDIKMEFFLLHYLLKIRIF